MENITTGYCSEGNFQKKIRVLGPAKEIVVSGILSLLLLVSRPYTAVLVLIFIPPDIKDLLFFNFSLLVRCCSAELLCWLSPGLQQQQPLFYGLCTGQPALPAPPVKNWRILLMQSFTTHMLLLAATSAFRL